MENGVKISTEVHCSDIFEAVVLFCTSVINNGQQDLVGTTQKWCGFVWCEPKLATAHFRNFIKIMASYLTGFKPMDYSTWLTLGAMVCVKRHSSFK